MLTLPEAIMPLLQPFRPVFSERVWDWVQVLVLGAILAPGRRTVSRLLRTVGLSQERQFQNYHRVLNRATWSGLQVSRTLLQLLVATFVPADATLVLGADDTLERRRGAKIAGLGCFRDAARSTAKTKVKSMGLRWLSLMLLVSVPWSQRTWALPFLTLLAPGAQSDSASGKRHKTLVDWLMQLMGLVCRWLPGRRLVLVVDGGLAAVRLGLRAQQYPAVTYVTRLRLDARLFDRPGARQPGQRGRTPKVGQRQPKGCDCLSAPGTDWQPVEVNDHEGKRRCLRFVSQVALWYNYGQTPLLGRWVLVDDPSGRFKPALLFATDPTATPEQILRWYLMRWSLEVTFEEVRAHLGFETQRQWSRLAIARTSPALLGLFAFVTLLAHQLATTSSLPCHSTAWYTKAEPTFSDCIALARTYLWQQANFPTYRSKPVTVEIPAPLFDVWLDLLAYAA